MVEQTRLRETKELLDPHASNLTIKEQMAILVVPSHVWGMLDECEAAIVLFGAGWRVASSGRDGGGKTLVTFVPIDFV